MTPIEQMQEIIEARPTITVREMADELGFSEEGSVYYWLRKAGFKGLRSFKASVLSHWSSPAALSRSHVSETETESYTASKRVIHSNEYVPWILPGDELHVQRRPVPGDGQLVLVSSGNESEMIRRYVVGSPPLLIHPVHASRVIRLEPDSPFEITACVVALHRPNP